MSIASFLLMKLAPISASAANDMALLIIFDTVWMGPLRGVLLLGNRSGLAERFLRK